MKKMFLYLSSILFMGILAVSSAHATGISDIAYWGYFKGMATGYIVNKITAPTYFGKGGVKPVTAIIKVTSGKYKGCRITGTAMGELSSEKALIYFKTIACLGKPEIEIRGFIMNTRKIVGLDGKVVENIPAAIQEARNKALKNPTYKNVKNYISLFEPYIVVKAKTKVIIALFNKE